MMVLNWNLICWQHFDTGLNMRRVWITDVFSVSTLMRTSIM